MPAKRRSPSAPLSSSARISACELRRLAVESSEEALALLPLTLARFREEIGQARVEAHSAAGLELAGEPGRGERPIAARRAHGGFENGGDLLLFEPAEEAHLDDLRLAREGGREPLERAIDIEELDPGSSPAACDVGELDVRRTAAALRGVALAGAIDQNPAHHGRRERQEVVAILVAHPVVADEPEIGFMYQSGRLQCEMALLAAQPLTRHDAQLAVERFDQALARSGVATAPGAQPAGDVGRQACACRPGVDFRAHGLGGILAHRCLAPGAARPGDASRTHACGPLPGLCPVAPPFSA